MRNNLRYIFAGFITSIAVVVILYIVVNTDIRGSGSMVTTNREGQPMPGPEQKKIEALRVINGSIKKTYDSGDTKGAIEKCIALIKKDKNNMDTRVLLGEFYTGTGEFQKAGDVLKDALIINPGSSWGLRAMGSLLYAENKLKASEEYFEKAVQSGSKIDAGWAYIGLAKVYLKTGKTQDMLASVAKAKRSDPENKDLANVADYISKQR